MIRNLKTIEQKNIRTRLRTWSVKFHVCGGGPRGKREEGLGTQPLENLDFKLPEYLWIPILASKNYSITSVKSICSTCRPSKHPMKFIYIKEKQTTVKVLCFNLGSLISTGVLLLQVKLMFLNIENHFNIRSYRSI